MLATGRISLVGQVKGEGSDEEVLQKRIPTAVLAEMETFSMAIMAEEDPVGQTRCLAEVKAAGLGDGNSKQMTWPSRLGETLHPWKGIKSFRDKIVASDRTDHQDNTRNGRLCEDITEWRKWIERGYPDA